MAISEHQNAKLEQSDSHSSYTYVRQLQRRMISSGVTEVSFVMDISRSQCMLCSEASVQQSAARGSPPQSLIPRERESGAI